MNEQLPPEPNPEPLDSGSLSPELLDSQLIENEQLPPEPNPEPLDSGSLSPELLDSQFIEDEDITAILPGQIVEAEAVGHTDVGRERHHNEDFYVVNHRFTVQGSPRHQTTTLRGLYILCDGMGGHAKGEVASALAAETLAQELGHIDEFPSHSGLKETILTANQAIYTVNEANNTRSNQDRMGTTLVLAAIQNNQAHIAHVGDSRIYSLTAGQGLQQLTVDHEVGQQQIQRGVSPKVAYGRPDAFQLTQALGPRNDQDIMPDISSFTISEDTLLLLCSDGLTDHDLLETHSESHLMPILSQKIGLRQGVSQLVGLANQYNGHDNITVVAIRLKVRPPR